MEIDRLKAIVLYVLNKVDGKCIGKHELFKILYFASQYHLIKYGDTIISDFYAFMYGPVPSELSDYLNSKNIITDSILFDFEANYILSPKEEANLEQLSKSEIECLNQSIEENFGLKFNLLTQKSHDSAWQKAWKKQSILGNRGAKIDIINMAIAAGATESTIEYIKEDLLLTATLS